MNLIIISLHLYSVTVVAIIKADGRDLTWSLLAFGNNDLTIDLHGYWQELDG